VIYKNLLKTIFLTTLMLKNTLASQNHRDSIYYGAALFAASFATIAKLWNKINKLEKQISQKDVKFEQIKDKFMQEIRKEIKAIEAERILHEQSIQSCKKTMDQIPEMQNKLEARLDAFDRKRQYIEAKEIENEMSNAIDRLRRKGAASISNAQQSYQSLFCNFNNLQAANTKLLDEIRYIEARSNKIISELQSSDNNAKVGMAGLNEEIRKIQNNMKSYTDKEIQRYSEKTQSIYFATFKDLEQISNEINKKKNDIYKYMQTLEKQLDKKMSRPDKERQQLEGMLKFVEEAGRDINSIKEKMENMREENNISKNNIKSVTALTKDFAQRQAKLEDKLAVLQNPNAYNYPQEEPSVNPMGD
jgi:chromosome segregation ATPase